MISIVFTSHTPDTQTRPQQPAGQYLRTLAIVSVSIVVVSIVLARYVHTISVLEMSGIMQSLVSSVSRISAILFAGVALLAGGRYVVRYPDVARRRWPASLGQVLIGAGIAMAIQSECLGWFLWAGVTSIVAGAVLLSLWRFTREDAGPLALETVLVAAGVVLPVLGSLAVDACDVYSGVPLCDPVAFVYAPVVACMHHVLTVGAGICVGIATWYACVQHSTRDVLSLVAWVSVTVLALCAVAHIIIYLIGIPLAFL